MSAGEEIACEKPEKQSIQGISRRALVFPLKQEIFLSLLFTSPPFCPPSQLSVCLCFVFISFNDYFSTQEFVGFLFIFLQKHDPHSMPLPFTMYNATVSSLYMHTILQPLPLSNATVLSPPPQKKTKKPHPIVVTPRPPLPQSTFSLWICLYLVFHVNSITRVTCYVWLRFSVLPCVSTTEQYFILQMCHIWFIHRLMDIIWFPFLAIVSSAATYTCVQVSVWPYGFSCLGHVPRSGIAGSRGKSLFNLLRSCQTAFSQWLHNFHSHQQCRVVPVSQHLARTYYGLPFSV